MVVIDSTFVNVGLLREDVYLLTDLGSLTTILPHPSGSEYFSESKCFSHIGGVVLVNSM